MKNRIIRTVIIRGLNSAGEMNWDKPLCGECFIWLFMNQPYKNQRVIVKLCFISPTLVNSILLKHEQLNPCELQMQAFSVVLEAFF